MHDVVEELVLRVPEIDARAVHVRHGVGDVEKVLEEANRHVLVERLIAAELVGDAQHGEAEARHPARPVALLELAAVGQGLVAIEAADVVHAEEAAAEDVAAARVLAIHPEAEREQLVLEHRLQELEVADARPIPLEPIDLPRRPAQHGRVHVVEVPLVGRVLPADVLVADLAHAQELLLGEGGVDARHRDAV